MTARTELAIAFLAALLAATPFAAGLTEWRAQHMEQAQ